MIHRKYALISTLVRSCLEIGTRPPSAPLHPCVRCCLEARVEEVTVPYVNGAVLQLVAAYIHEAFYSVDARVRNKPARVELSRLTVRQYQNALADLIGSFRFA